MTRFDQLAGVVVTHHRAIILGASVLTLVLASGIPAVELTTSHDQFVGETATSETNDYVETSFHAGPENATTTQIIITREYHVIGPRDLVKQLRFQRRLQEDDRVAPTLAETPPTGIANVIAFQAIRQTEDGDGDGGGAAAGSGAAGGASASPADDNERSSGSSGAEAIPQPRPPLGEQYRKINDSSNWNDMRGYERGAIRALNSDVSGPPAGVYAFVPSYYDSAYEQQAHATVIYVYQRDDLSSEELLRSQTAMREIAEEEFRRTPGTSERVYGTGIVDDEIARATIDSLRLVGAVGLVLALVVLWYVYSDPYDMAVALTGVALVLIWSIGFMGWVGIDFNPLFVSIPLFLAGLSIDFAIHAVTRYREERDMHEEPGGAHRDRRRGERPASGRVRAPMRNGIASVGRAFVLVTLTTVTAFASSLTSHSSAIREFGLLATVGIVAALVIFTTVVPALKIELEERLLTRGHERRNPPLGMIGERTTAMLERSVVLAERAPWLVIGVALLATTAGLAGASGLETEFDKKELHVKDTPDGLDALPAAMAPGEYHTYETLEFLRKNGFVNDQNTAHVLVEGNVTHPATLERTAAARRYAENSTATLEFGRHDVRVVDQSTEPIPTTMGPVRAMRAVAAQDEAFNETFHGADTDGNGVPDRNLSAVFDAFVRADAAAAGTVLHWEDGEYRALRVGLYTDGTVPTRTVAAETRTTAVMVEDGHDSLSATATGQPVIRADVQERLFSTVLRSFALTLLVVIGILVGIFRWTRDTASLGIVVIVPVLCAVAWILGTMAFLGLPFNILTALITSFTVGIGVDYAIHLAERYVQEAERLGAGPAALRTAVHGTGGAILGSALTTAVGFGVLVFALLEPLRQFGAIVALSIGYAFLGSVIVLPSLLVLWTRHVADPVPEAHCE